MPGIEPRVLHHDWFVGFEHRRIRRIVWNRFGPLEIIETKVQGALGEHRDVTGAQLDGCGAHALCNEALQFGLDGAIFSGHDFDAPGRLPSFASLYAALWNAANHSTLMLAPRITLPHFLVYSMTS